MFLALADKYGNIVLTENDAKLDVKVDSKGGNAGDSFSSNFPATLGGELEF